MTILFLIWKGMETYPGNGVMSSLQNAPKKRNMLHAILDTPWARRRQTLAVAFWFYFPVLSMFFFVFMAWYWSYCWPILLVYFSWMMFSLKGPFNGADFNFLAKMFPKWTLFNHFSPYFPILMEYDDKDCEDIKDRQFMFGYHPHGIFGLGAVATFALDRPGYLGKLPLRLLTVDLNFYIPLWREFLLSIGLAGVGLESVRELLKTGHSLAIVIGGAREALDAAPGMSDLVLRKRKGFFREALIHGCSVVPVFGFGENELYEQVCQPTSRLRIIQNRLIHLFGFTLPLFNGRGMFNYERGVLPRRRPIHVVIGCPIRTERVLSPSPKDIDNLQEQYISELTRIYDKYKDKYIPDRKRSLTIIQ
jgi:2-acylglycerol O-acyltransferase 2